MGEKIAEVSVEDTVATHRLLTLLREFDAGNGWGMQRAFTCAHWLSWRVGLSLGAAREYVRVAKALGELPEIDAAFRNDEDRRSVRCYPDGNGMMRIVAVVRVEEADIIMRALDAGREAVGAGEKVDVSAETSAGAHSDERAGKTAMEAEVDISAETSSGVRSSEAEEKAFADEVDELADILGDVADDPEVRDAEEAAQRREREAARRIEEEEDEATLHTTGAFDRRARAEEVRRWGSQAEALVLLAESFLAGRRGQRNGGARTVMTVHVDSAVLSGSRKDGLSELEDGTRLAPETVRRLACDASVVRIGYRIEVGEGGAITFCAPSGMKLESAPSLPELTPEVLAALEEEHCVAKHELCGDHLRPINYTPMNLDYAVSSLLAAHAVRHAAAHQAV